MDRFDDLARAGCAPDEVSESVIRRAHQLVLTQRNAAAEAERARVAALTAAAAAR